MADSETTIESTSAITRLVVDGHEVPARIWHGRTESGIPMECYVTRITPFLSESNPRIEELTAEFERDLLRQADPIVLAVAIPIRMVL